MNTKRILMPVRTVAEWGGVHEWTVDAATALINNGCSVTFVGQGEVFKERALATGAAFKEIEWTNWSSAAQEIGEQGDFDLIFSHAPGGRQFGLKVNQLAKKEHVVMIHGAYHDYMYEWSDQVDAFVAASPSLVHFAQRFGRVAPWKVSNLPNAAPSEIFDMPLISHDEKLADGIGVILTASRLSPDKLSQIDAVESAARILVELHPDIEWRIDVYGDGPLRNVFENRYRLLSTRLPRVSYQMHGWVAPNEVPMLMQHAYLTVTAGMAGMRALASGSLCLGTGAKSYVGLQVGKNLRAGIWSNFGDHGVLRFTPTDLHKDLAALATAQAYDAAVHTAREVSRRGNHQDIVNGLMLSALQCG